MVVFSKQSSEYNVQAKTFMRHPFLRIGMKKNSLNILTIFFVCDQMKVAYKDFLFIYFGVYILSLLKQLNV